MKNKTKCYDYDELNKDLLKSFSEGSVALESLLIYCYENKIQTKACCIGHKDENELNIPYILIVVPIEQEYIMENLINNLLTLGKFSKHIMVDITTNFENNMCKAAFSINYQDKEVREEFFNLIKKFMHNAIVKGINDTEIYNGIFESYRQVHAKNNIDLISITHEGMTLFEFKHAFLKIVGNDTIEVSEEEADFDCDIPANKYFIKTEEIANFIETKKGTHNIKKI